MSKVQTFDDIYKIVLLGDSKVGKTTFLSQYIPNTDSKTRNQINDMEAKTETLANGAVVDVQVWDLTGDPSYRSVSEIFLKNTLGAMVLFDLSSSESLKSVKGWVKDLRSQSKDCQVFIVGNKKDLLKSQVESTGKDLAISLNAEYFEVSSLSKKDVEKVFQEMIQKLSVSTPAPSSMVIWVAILLLLVGLAYYVRS
jgi:small GTP-binding protein